MIRDFKINILSHWIILNIRKNYDIHTVGITNETPDNFFVPFIDYDDCFLDVVVKDHEHLQKIFGIGPLLIVSSNSHFLPDGREFGNYIVFGFDKLLYSEHQNLLSHTRCDIDYLKIQKKMLQKSWTLRIREKTDLKGKIYREEPKYRCVLPSKDKSRYIGYTAVLEFLRMNFKLKLGDYNMILNSFSSWDDSKIENIEFIEYPAYKR